MMVLRPQFIRAIVMMATAGAVLCAVAAGETIRQQLAGFTLNDQHKRQHEVHFPRGKITVLIAADEKGSRQIESWLTPLKERFADRVDLVGVAEVSSVPGFLRNRVRGKFAERWRHPVLLDWKGEVVSSLGLQSGEVGLFVLDRAGRVLHRENGKFSEEKMRNLSATLRETEGTEPGMSPPGE